jgi:hypothetical protein
MAATIKGTAAMSKYPNGSTCRSLGKKGIAEKISATTKISDESRREKR